jgi:2-oxoglutarate dehydrogenase E2 component (dihydrolipoamide succinyltransferase)
MITEVKVPEVGESITEGVLLQWFKQNGDNVQEGESLFELETDKISVEVPAECSGQLQTLVAAGATVSIGQVVARIDTEAAQEPAVPEPTYAPATKEEEPSPVGRSEREPSLRAEEAAGVEGPPITTPAGFPQAQAKLAAMKGDETFSPAVRRMVEEFKLDPWQITATGKGGRITKQDVVRHLQSTVPDRDEAAPARKAPAQAERPEPEQEPKRAEPERIKERQTRVPLSRLRQRLAERLILVTQTTAMLTTFNEADMSNVIAWRNKHKAVFAEKHDVGLGFMSFFVKAVVDALKNVPQVNAQIEGDELVHNHYYDIGVAISTDRGLVVPVIRDADKMSFADIERGIADLAQRSRNKQLSLMDLTGGVFTITNGGVFGSLMSTPILNPPQSGILGMHAIKKRPVVINDEIVVRPMMYLALSYDHRVVDGREAVTFLKRVVECVEDPERMLLEV